MNIENLHYFYQIFWSVFIQAIVQHHKNGSQVYLWTDLKGQSHEKVGEMSVWGISLGPI
jgi:hypothetical protein